MPNNEGSGDNQPQNTLYESEGKGPVVIDAPVTWKEGDVIAGLYEVKGVLGEGRFGTVYKVYHQSWKIELAVKSPKEDVLDDKGAVSRFLKEAQTWVEMGMHPNIVTCFYVRELGKIPRIFLEYAEGGNLRDKLNKGISLEEAIDLAIQICHGMDYAQKHNLVHRDLKPENCVLDKYGNLKVTDFGLVKIEEAEGVSEQKNMGKTGRAGTPEYMAPEQWVNAAEATTKADIWALGAMLYEMCVGSKPFKAEEDEPAYTFYARLISTKWAYPELPQNLPQGLKSLIKECLHEGPGKRPESFNNLEERLSVIYKQIAGRPYPRVKVTELSLLADGLNNRAVSLIDLGRRDDAEKIFNEALSIEPSHLQSTYNRGLLLWRSARMTDQELVARLKEAIIVSEQVQLAGYLLGLVHLERGNWQAAITEFESVLQQSQITDDNSIETEAKEALDRARDGFKDHGQSNRTFEGHADGVASICVSPDGRLALSGSGEDHALRLCDLATGRCLRTFEGHAYGITSVSISPDGKYGLSGSWDETVRLWDLANGCCLRTFEGHIRTHGVTSVCISPDGRLGLSGSTDKTMRLWDLANGRCLRTFPGHTSWVRSVCISPDNRFALSGSDDKTLRLWDLATGRCLRTFEGHDDGVESVCISPDGRLGLSGSTDKTMRVWNLVTVQCSWILKGHIGGVTSVCISPDGRYGLSGSWDKTLRLWDLATGRCLRTFEGHTDGVESVCIFPDGRFALSGSSDKTLRLWDLALGHEASFAIALPRSFAELSQLNLEVKVLLNQAESAVNTRSLRSAAMHLNQARGIQGYNQSEPILDSYHHLGFRGIRHNLNSAWQLRTFEGHTEMVNSVCMSPDGRFALSGSDDKTMRLWDLAIGQCLRTFEGHTDRVQSVCISPNGRLGLSGSLDKTIRLWDLATGQCLRTFEGHTEYVHSVCISPDGRLGLSGSTDETLRLWDLATGQCMRIFEGHLDRVWSNCISPDGRYGLSTGFDNILRVWDLVTGQCLRILKGHTGTAHSVCISPDGRSGLSGSLDKTLRLWDLATGQCLRTFEGHNDYVESVCISPDGRYGLSGSYDKTLRLWDLATGRCLRIFEGQNVGVKSICISPDGRFGLSGSYDKTLRLWEFVYDYEFPEEIDWDEGAKPYVEIFLTMHCPYANDGISRQGKPQWNEEDFKGLMRDLGYRGYGWLREDGIRKKLNELAKKRH